MEGGEWEEEGVELGAHGMREGEKGRRNEGREGEHTHGMAWHAGR